MKNFIDKELKNIKSRVFALLPMYEEKKDDEIKVLLSNIRIDCGTLKEMYDYDILNRLISCLNIINSLIYSSGNHKEIKKNVFRIINNIDRWCNRCLV